MLIFDNIAAGTSARRKWTPLPLESQCDFSTGDSTLRNVLLAAVAGYRESGLAWSREESGRWLGRAELLANPAIRARIFAGSIQTPHGLPNFA